MGTPLHTWQQTAQGKAPFAHKGMVHAAKVMAATARAAILSQTLRDAAKKAHEEHLAAFPYNCPIPATTKPPIAAE
jgi:aminobenzoyl-glutamate utilization protein B